MADISPASAPWESLFCKAVSYGFHGGTTITGVTTIGTPPADVPARRRVAVFRTFGGGAVAFDLSDPVTGVYRIDNMPPGLWEVVVFGIGVHRSEVIGPIEVP